MLGTGAGAARTEFGPPAGVVRFPTAGLVWEFRKTPRGSGVHVVIPSGRRTVALPGIVVHRSCSMAECDIVRRTDGIAVTSPPRTAFDASFASSANDLESLIEARHPAPMFTIPTLWGVARRLRRQGRPGSARFGEVLRSREVWRRPVDSDYELRLERAMRRRGFPPLQRQCRIELANGDVIHPDLGLPEHGFYVEVDHLTWHGGRMAADYDSRRDLYVSALGFRVERVTDVSIDHHLGETVDALWEISHSFSGARCTESVHELLRTASVSPARVDRAASVGADSPDAARLIRFFATHSNQPTKAIGAATSRSRPSRPGERAG